MPRIRLKSFLEKVKKADESLSTTKLCLKTKKGFHSFIAALNDPANLAVQSVTELDLSGSEKLSVDKIIKLVDALNKCPNIKTLHLNDCKITDEMSAALMKATHIESLSLQNNELQRPIFNTKLSALDLENNEKLDAKSVVHYFTIRSPKKLQTLSLNACNVRDSALTPLISHYRKVFPVLTHLSLRGNKLTPKAIEGVAAISSLTTLDLSKNPLNKKSSTNQGMEFLKRLDALKTLSLDGCHIDAVGFMHIAQMQLHSVNLSYNPGIKLAGLNGISLERVFNGEKADEAKSDEVKPAKVKLNKTKPTDVLLGEVKRDEVPPEPIKPNQTLQVMNLSFCNLKDIHVAVLRRAFPQLTQLSMPNNSLTAKGVINLLENPNLHSLDIAYYRLYTKYTSNGNMRQRKARVAEGKKNIEPLLDAIRQAPELTEINLIDTGLTSKMLLSLIPSAEEPVQKLETINGVPCAQLKKDLEQDIAAKKEAKELEKQEALSKPVESPKIELVEIKPQPKLTKTDQRIKILEAENAGLRAELAMARAEISHLKGKDTPEELTSTTSVKKIVDKLEETSGSSNAKGLNSSGIFASKKPIASTKKTASESAPQPSSSQ